MKEESIFAVAIEKSSLKERAAYLDEACDGDSELRARVEALLQAHDAPDSLFQSAPDPALAATVDKLSHDGVTDGPGAVIGNYKLLQQVGEGGFGVVYMAEQQKPVRRKVALKVIKPGMDSRAVVARFEAERQALALMDHPNIARVLDGGATDGGAPYFVMELVRGVPVTEYCDKNHLSMPERLGLFVTVCQAVQHAHQKGIIHRDLKPSNIMVTLHDGQPVVKVIDFGISKAINQQLTEKTLFTAYGQMIGTPQYMSPEQAEMSGLDVDTRSDIYSLGVLLYELLTGSTPLDAERLRTAGYAEMQRIICEEEPQKPSTRLSTSGDRLTIIAQHRSATPERLHKLVRGDLDWIVMKALEKDRRRRYETAEAVAADISRYSNDNPIEARPPSSAYRLRKFVQRNTVAVATSIVVLVSLVGGITGTTSGWLAARRLLKDYQDELFHRAMSEAMSHDANAEQTIKDAADAGLPEDRLELIRGFHMIYNGAPHVAIDHLTNAVQLEKNSAALALLAWAQAVAGHHAEFSKAVEELADCTPTSAEDYLFCGHLDAVFSPEQGLQEIDRAIKARNTPMAHAIKAIALANLASRRRDSLQLASAIDEVKAARVFAEDNSFAAISDLYTHHVAYRMACREGNRQAQELYLESAMDAASDLHGFPVPGPQSHWTLAMFFADIGNGKAAMTEWQKRMEMGSPGFASMNLAACAIQFGRERKALELLEPIKDRRFVFTEIARGFLMTCVGEAHEVVLECYNRAVRQHDTADVHMHAVHLLLLLGESEYARQEAKRLLPKSRELVAPYSCHMQFLAGESPSSEFLEASPLLGDLDIGLRALSEGKRDLARRHFDTCVQNGHVWTTQYQWANALRKRMEDPNWPDWISSADD